MHIDVFDGPMRTSAALNQTVMTKLRAALRAVGDRVQGVQVRFRDDNAGKGGVDKRCRIAARVSGGTVVVESTHTDFYAALDVAVHRLRAALTRRSGRAGR